MAFPVVVQVAWCFFLFDAIDLFSFGGLCSNYRPRDMLSRFVLLSSTNYSFIFTRSFDNFKARITKLKLSTYGEMNLTK